MQTYLSLKFLQEKISHLQTALFFNLTSGILKIPASIINVLEVDDAGQIWFCLPAPGHSIDVFDKKFFSELQFFRKGKSFYLKILGKGFIVNDPEDVNAVDFLDYDFKGQITSGKLMLIKVIIQAADYFETKIEPKKEFKINMLPGVRISDRLNDFSMFIKKRIFPEHHHQVV